MTLNKIKLSENISEAVREDILDLQEKIGSFKKGLIPEERFKSFRLTRGVYGQRQLGVQMFRIKIPYGKLTTRQLSRIADISEEYTNGNLHTTTRQNIQLHYVHVEDTPEMWAKLEEVGITVKEACGNTVRNVTASPLAGIDPEEPFDVSPYAESVFRYFLGNPVGQDMGRKIKITFSSSERDSAYTYFQDFGFIPRIRQDKGEELRGFKVVVGGGLGAQPFIAETAYEFLPEERLIPFLEAALRVFDRYGEREKRMKARLKFLLDEKRGIGLEKFLQLVEEEYPGLPQQRVKVDRSLIPFVSLPEPQAITEVEILNQEKYALWLKTNVFEQKQAGYYGVQIKLELGNISSEKAKELARLVQEGIAADDIRVTINQGLLLKYVRKESLPYLFYRLNHLELAEPGFGTIADVTACPGTDTCNLGVTNSTGIALELERLIREEYPELITDNTINIKISGCMNSCGQHMAANIGFHGSSIKNKGLVVPALQVVLGGGVDPSGKGFIAEKVIKLPSKKVPQALRYLLDDYAENAIEGEYFNDYFTRQGKMHFYNLLKPLAELSELKESDYIDWGHDEAFVPEIGTGECAGISYDVVGTIITDAEERLYLSEKAFDKARYSDSVYHAYSAMIIGAKALLLSKDLHCNTHQGIITDFDHHYYETSEINLTSSFEKLVLQINKQEPAETFVGAYRQEAAAFLQQVKELRQQQLNEVDKGEDKVVVQNYYKA